VAGNATEKIGTYDLTNGLKGGEMERLLRRHQLLGSPTLVVCEHAEVLHVLITQISRES
jgi:hypothetical protein